LPFDRGLKRRTGPLAGALEEAVGFVLGSVGSLDAVARW
jgi:hypothetical protein